jgi:hypothetical protein
MRAVRGTWSLPAILDRRLPHIALDAQSASGEAGVSRLEPALDEGLGCAPIETSTHRSDGGRVG